ncbi:hypothetical protein OG599_08555 [Streptomyces sp. NBC_01335]|nr:hypothetical protein OG599_08555 [Streptomyces sp. NBC_01335]
MPPLWHVPPTAPRPLGEHWGQRVHVVAEDQCALRLHLDGYGTLPTA